MISLAAHGGDPDPYDWRLAVKTVLAFAVLLFLADVLL